MSGKVAWLKAWNWGLIWRIQKWWLKTGLIAIPFGIVYASTVQVLHHESKFALVVVLTAAIVTNYLIQGMPPEE